MIKNILIAFDGSKNSIAAAEAGINLAELAGAFITVVYVAEVIPPYMVSDFAPIPGALGDMRNALLARAEEALATARKMAKGAGIGFETVVAEGNPSAEILRIAKEKNVDLLVLGSLGKTGLEKIMLGSVAEKLVRRSTVPMMVVPEKMD